VSLQLLKSAYNKHYDQSVIKQTQITEWQFLFTPF
jgi:hypothetical protein